MTAAAFDDLLKQAERLPRKDRLRLAAHLVKTGRSPETPPMKWEEIRGSLPHPAPGEDAQTWISRNRAASDARENQWTKK